ncbi:unnamed protein product, partial [Didymodactylos carnosus]
HNQICTSAWKCFTLINGSTTNNDDYTDDDILDQINQTNQNYEQIKEQLTNETQKYTNCNDDLQNIQQTLTEYARKINEIFTNSINQNSNLNTLTTARTEIENLETNDYLDPFKHLILNSIEQHLQIANDINSLLLTYGISDDNQ